MKVKTMIDNILNMKRRQLNILVLGSNGMLGHDVMKLLNEKAQDKNTIIGKVIGLDVADGIDVCKRHAIGDYMMNSIHYDYCINCIAYTDTGKAESTSEGKDLDFKLNALAPKYIAESCAYWKTKLIHVSTDYVFSEKSEAMTRKNSALDVMFKEDDEVFPVNTYGKNKLLGEEFIANEFMKKGKDKNFCILRTSWLYGAHNNKSFIHKFLKNVASYQAKLQANPPPSNEMPVLTMTSNEVSVPTSTRYVAECIYESIVHKLHGVKHAVCEFLEYGVAGVSRLEFANKILEECKELKVLEAEQIGSSHLTSVERDTYQPKFSAMQSSFYGDEFTNISARTWEQVLHRFMIENGLDIIRWAKAQI